MNKKIKALQTDFFARTKKYDIPSNNKIFYFLILSREAEADPTNKELQDLLLTFICGSNLIISRFSYRQSREGLMEDYKDYLIRKSQLKKAIATEARLAKEWAEIKQRKTLPTSIRLTKSELAQCETEAEGLCGLYLKYFLFSKEEYPELYWNLLSFCKVSRALPKLHKIAPFFFYQIMVKHTKRLLKVTGLQFSLKSLWDYKEYQIEKDNGKNYKKYKSYNKLFVALCKQFKQDPAVDIPLCRYAFSHTSNMIDWIREFRFFKANKFQSKLMSMADFNVTLSEEFVPEEYYEKVPYYFTDEEFIHYYLGETDENEPDYSGYFEEATAAFEHYIEKLNNCGNEEEAELDFLLYNLAVNINYDTDAVYKTLKKLYEKAELGKIYPDGIPMKCRLANLYDALKNSINTGLLKRVKNALAAIAENYQV